MDLNEEYKDITVSQMRQEIIRAVLLSDISDLRYYLFMVRLFNDGNNSRTDQIETD